MSTTPLFSIEIEYIDIVGNLQTVLISSSQNQNIAVRAVQDKDFIQDKNYLSFNKITKKLFLLLP